MEKYCRAGRATDDNITRHMDIACWIPKATDTLRICNTAFLLQHWLHERSSMLRCTYSTCLVQYCCIGARSVCEVGSYQNCQINVRPRRTFRNDLLYGNPVTSNCPQSRILWTLPHLRLRYIYCCRRYLPSCDAV